MRYLQRAFGYSITGSTIEKAIFVPFGESDAGKSTMLGTFRSLIKEYSTLIQVDTLMVPQESNNTQSDVADLRGARFAQTSETDEGQRLSQAKLKRITQGIGDIKAARKYENQIIFPETHKLWMDTNRTPSIPDATDDGSFVRLHPIPFTIRIPEESIDREMPAKLLAEAEGILAWAVRGAIEWHRSGLQRPKEIETARSAWRAEVDQLKHFIDAECDLGLGDILAKLLYSAYSYWAENNGEHAMTGTAFGRQLSSKGFERVHTNRGEMYLGIRLKSNQ